MKKKLKKQKGTGTARSGSIKSPVFRGGGRIFGPKPRNYGFKLNKNVKLSLWLIHFAPKPAHRFGPKSALFESIALELYKSFVRITPRNMLHEQLAIRNFKLIRLYSVIYYATLQVYRIALSPYYLSLPSTIYISRWCVAAMCMHFLFQYQDAICKY